MAAGSVTRAALGSPQCSCHRLARLIREASDSIAAEGAMEEILAGYQQFLADLITAEPVSFDSGETLSLPTGGGVYRVCERRENGVVTIYVGKSQSLKRRVHSDHLRGDRTASTLKNKLIRYTECEDEEDVKQFLIERCHVQFVEIPEADSRALFEHFAVAMLRPEYND